MHSKFLVTLLCAFLCASLGLAAQELPEVKPRTLTGLQLLDRAAGMIFAGTVTSVHRIPAKKENEVETVQITFRVTHALRGARAGMDLTIREWSGVWATGERYRAGERVLLFLYPPSKLGLTSPVGGWQGRFAMDERWRVAMRDELLQQVTGQGGASGSLPLPGKGGAGAPRVRVSYRELFRAVQRASKE